VLAALVAELGLGPFVSGLRSVGPEAVLLALVVTAGTTACCARRWSVVSRALGADPLPLRAAVPAYYRSQLINATLPGGVLGDVDRALRHRLGGTAVTGLRAVACERAAGLGVQVAVTVLVVGLAAAGAVRPGPLVAVVLLAVVAGWWLLPGRAREVCALSVAALAGHALLFAVAARTVGLDVGLTQLVPVALVVLLGSAIPANIAGWGPREGVAAWAFAATGAGAAQGVAVSVAFGVMALVATLPGVVVLLAGRHVAETGAPVGVPSHG
jgi:uncharacterized membrane protein YbhN (UPF0104 family)